MMITLTFLLFVLALIAVCTASGCGFYCETQCCFASIHDVVHVSACTTHASNDTVSLSIGEFDSGDGVSDFTACVIDPCNGWSVPEPWAAVTHSAADAAGCTAGARSSGNAAFRTLVDWARSNGDRADEQDAMTGNVERLANATCELTICTATLRQLCDLDCIDQPETTGGGDQPEPETTGGGDQPETTGGGDQPETTGGGRQRGLAAIALLLSCVILCSYN